MRITFIRHGASELTGKPVLVGHTDSPLSELGRQQAGRLGERLRGRPFDALWASPLSRARDTAAAIGQAIGHAAVLDKRLMEVHLGELEGAHFGQLNQAPGGWRDRWQRNPGRVRFPKGENLQEVAKRSWQVLEHLYDRHPHGHVIVVSHMFTISTMLCRVLRLKVGQFRTFAVDPASVSTVQLDASGLRLMLLNDTSHLDGLDGDKLRSGALPARGGPKLTDTDPAS